MPSGSKALFWVPGKLSPMWALDPAAFSDGSDPCHPAARRFDRPDLPELAGSAWCRVSQPNSGLFCRREGAEDAGWGQPDPIEQRMVTHSAILGKSLSIGQDPLAGLRGAI